MTKAKNQHPKYKHSQTKKGRRKDLQIAIDLGHPTDFKLPALETLILGGNPGE